MRWENPQKSSWPPSPSSSIFLSLRPHLRQSVSSGERVCCISLSFLSYIFLFFPHGFSKVIYFSSPPAGPHQGHENSRTDAASFLSPQGSKESSVAYAPKDITVHVRCKWTYIDTDPSELLFWSNLAFVASRLTMLETVDFIYSIFILQKFGNFCKLCFLIKGM